MTVATSDEVLGLVTRHGVDFLDLGCSSGGSLEFAVRQFGLRHGLGVDIDPRKVAAARESGKLAVVADARSFTSRTSIVRLTQGIHFLEHLPDLASAQSVVRAAARASSDAVFFRQPFFDADTALAELGLKLYWSDWHGHPNHMTVAGFVEVLDELTIAGDLSGYVVLGRGAIGGSDDDAVHPMASPRDQHAYAADQHGPKPPASFDFPVYRELVVIGLRTPTTPLAARLARYASFCDYLDGSASRRFFTRWLREA